MNFKCFYIVFLIGLIGSCARVGTPTGGPKDEKPPVTISASPDFGSTHFNSTKIKINFDEYIKFKDLNKQLIISPPMKNQPEITPVGTTSKSINIKILDTLKENTTYTFNFGNSIIDNAEGNVLKQFKYLFSTGEYIDSLKISGSVKDAYKKKTESSIYIMLYEVNGSYNDSIIYKQKPDYLSNTLDSVIFQITNIKEGKYAMIALKDKSNNMIYNPGEDEIGFLTNPISLPNDSLAQLSLFKEIPTFQIKSTVESSKNKLIIGYEGSWNAELKDIKDKNGKSIYFIQNKVTEKDSLYVWYRDVMTDTINLMIENKGEIENYYVRLRNKQRDSLSIQTTLNQTLDFRDTLSYTSNIPMLKIDAQKVKLIDKDSLNIDFQIIESVGKDKFYIDFNKKPSSSYKLLIEPGAIEDFFGQTNDSIKKSFTTRKIEDYGELKINLQTNEKSQIIFEVLNDKLDIIATEYFKEAKNFTFKYLLPGKYTFRAILDVNENSKWDTGIYLKKIQPEKVVYYSKEIELRANWTVVEEFIVNFTD